MKKVCLFLKNSEFLAKITALQIWGEDTDFEIRAVCSDMASLLKLTESDSYDLLIAESNLIDNENYGDFMSIRSQGRIVHIALCGENADFEAARKGLMIGAEEYFVLPFDERLFRDFFDGLISRSSAIPPERKPNTKTYSQKLMELFIDRGDVNGYLYQLEAGGDFAAAVDEALHELFGKYEWLDMYFNEVDIRSDSLFDYSEQKSRFLYLYETFTVLYPIHNEVLDNLIEYVLFNPEGDLRQKVLSEEMHINKSYLSTVFTAQTGIRFVDYISNVRLYRAAWLLKNTELRISEIATRIEYRDFAYFSKLFKKKFGCSPSEFRLPDSYHFEI